MRGRCHNRPCIYFRGIDYLSWSNRPARAWRSRRIGRDPSSVKRKRAPLGAPVLTTHVYVYDFGLLLVVILVVITLVVITLVVVMFERDSGKRGCAFHANGIQAIGVKAQDLEDRRSHLSRFHKAVQGFGT